ncbi:hypothetical protein [Streptosporangium saharense]
MISASTLLVSGGPSSHVSPGAPTRMCGMVTVEDAGHRVHSPPGGRLTAR